MLEFRLLGEVSVLDEGQPLQIRGPKQRGLLAMLLLARGEVVSRDRLTQGLWGASPPPRVDHALDAQVSTLRRALGPAADRLVRRTPGYALRLQPGELDLDRFENARAHSMATGTDQEVAAGLRDALALWRGPALADVRSEPFADDAATDLDERRIAVVEDRVEADLGCGLGPELVGELQGLVAEHPFRDRLVASLATALYRSGRQAAAFEVLAAARRRYAHELGIDTGPVLKDLQRRLLDRDPALVPRATRSQPASPPRRHHAVARLVIAAAVALLLNFAAGDASPTSMRLSGGDAVALDGTTGRVLGQSSPALDASSAAGDATSVWFTDPDNEVVVRIDARTGAVTGRLNVETAPLAIATGDGAAWVVGTGSVSRVDATTQRLTQTIRLPGQPTSVAYGAGRLWIADETGRTLTRIRPDTGAVEQTTRLPNAPTGLAVSSGVIWVASYAASLVSAIDARTLAPVASVAVGRGPVALAADNSSVWVANSLDATVSRIDARRPRVGATISVGGSPHAIALADSSVWVASEARSVARIDARTNTVTRRVPLTAGPTALGAAGGAIVLTAPPASDPTGGTLRMLSPSVPPSIDPAQQVMLRPGAFLGLSQDGLVTYDHAGGVRGLRLVPDLADGLPTVGTSTSVHFRLRPGLKYSTGVPVLASDFRRAFERLFRTSSPGIDYYRGIAGADRCGPRTCDLASGVATDDVARTITFHLIAPDPDFLDKLAALNYASPVPPGTPMRDTGYSPVPGTGPYRIARADSKQVRFVRNPQFREWSRAAQPAGGPDVIVWRLGGHSVDAARAVLAGKADRTYVSLPADVATTIINRHPAQWHANDLLQTDFLQLSPRTRPFSDVRARRAVNLAVDRTVLVRHYGGASQARATCQVLPPRIRGHRTYCPYTRGTAPDGWRAPDLPRARRLVAATGTTGGRVLVWSFSDLPFPDGVLDEVVDALRRIGYRVIVRTGDHSDFARLSPRERRAIDLIPSSWLADYPSPSSFFDTQLACSSASTGGFWCDPALDCLLRRARVLEANDPAAADSVWALADRRAVDRAAWVPLVNTRELEVVSERLRGYRYGPVLGFIASQSRVTGR